MTDLELYVAPQGLVTVLPDRLLTGDATKDQAIMRQLWRNPHCFLVTHRSAPALLKLAKDAGLPTD